MTAAEQTQTGTDFETHLGDTLHYLRKTAKISQEEMGKLLGIHQTAVCRVEKGLQSLTPEQLFVLTKHFDVKLDSLLDGRIDYWKIAERFGRKPLLPKRYTEFPFSKNRELLPLLKFAAVLKSEEYASEMLISLGLKQALLKDPDMPIGVNVALDLFTYLLKDGSLSKKTFKTLINQTRLEETQGFLHPIYQTQEGSLALVQTWTLNAHHYDSNFKYEIEEVDSKHITLTITPAIHMRQVQYKTDVLGDVLCEYKKRYFEQFPAYINEKPLKLEETSCHFHGNAKCVYKLSTL